MKKHSNRIALIVSLVLIFFCALLVNAQGDNYKWLCNKCNTWISKSIPLENHYATTHPSSPGGSLQPSGIDPLQVAEWGVRFAQAVANDNKAKQEKLQQAQMLERQRIAIENARLKHIKDSIDNVRFGKMMTLYMKISQAGNLDFDQIGSNEELKPMKADEEIRTVPFINKGTGTETFGHKDDLSGYNDETYWDTKVVDLRDYKRAAYIGASYGNSVPSYGDVDIILDEALKVANGGTTDLILPDESHLTSISESGLKEFQQQNIEYRKAHDFRLKQTEVYNTSLENKALAQKAIEIQKQEIETAISNNTDTKKLHETMSQLSELLKEADGYVIDSKNKLDAARINEELEKIKVKDILKENPLAVTVQIKSKGEFYILTKDGRQLKGTEATIPFDGSSKILTGKDGHVWLTLPDNTSFTITNNSEVILDDFVYDPSLTVEKYTASVIKGVFRLVTGKVARNTKYDKKVNLPVDAVGIRGTDVEFFVATDNSGYIKLFSGEIDLTENLSKVSFIMKGGYIVKFDSKGVFTKPEPLK